MAGGNLEDRLLLTTDGRQRLAMLSSAERPPLPWQTRCRVLCETLRALTYLHELTPKVLNEEGSP